MFSEVVENMYACMTKLWCQSFSSDVKFGCNCILIFSEVVEYMYACMTRFWMSTVFMINWYHVLTCLYTYILRSCGIFVCLYDRNMTSWFSCLDVPVYLYSLKLWNICMLVWPSNEVTDFILRNVCMLVFPEVAECLYMSIVETFVV
jgi:hypothetical protein